MRVLILLLSVIASVQAVINGIAVPKTIKPGDGFNAIIMASNHIQSSYYVGIAFGANVGTVNSGALGQILDSYYLGPEQSNIITNFTKWVQTKPSIPKGSGRITASLHGLFGAAAAPALSLYDVPVTFGDVTSTEYVASQ